MQGDIAQFRAFNRFHTRLAGALNEGLLATDLSLAQARVIYELANPPGGEAPSASDLTGVLGIDAGYLSRLIGGLQARGLITREASATNAKRLALRLSKAGAQVFAALDAASEAEAGGLLAPLSDQDRRKVLGAMATIRRHLGDPPAPAAFTLRDPEPGDLARVIEAQTRLYAQEYGWDWTFEALLCEITAHFIRNFDASGERAWIAQDEGRIVGSVFVMRQDAQTAKLRMLYVDASVRGRGLGRTLVNEALRFARAKGYTRMQLWTNDILTSARRIYETAGFTLIQEEAHESFGRKLVGQVWSLDL